MFHTNSNMYPTKPITPSPPEAFIVCRNRPTSSVLEFSVGKKARAIACFSASVPIASFTARLYFPKSRTTNFRKFDTFVAIAKIELNCAKISRTNRPCQRVAPVKHITAQLCEPVWEHHASQEGGAPKKHTIAQLRESDRERHTLQGGAPAKHLIVQLRDLSGSATRTHTREEHPPVKHTIAQLHIRNRFMKMIVEKSMCVCCSYE